MELEPLVVAGNRVTEDEVDGGDEDVDFDAEPDPPGVGDDRLGRAEQIEQPDDGDERRVLEETDEGADERRDRDPQRLRQHDEEHRAPEPQSNARGRFVLPGGHRVEPGANHLREIRRDDHRERHLRP